MNSLDDVVPRVLGPNRRGVEVQSYRRKRHKTSLLSSIRPRQNPPRKNGFYRGWEPNFFYGWFARTRPHAVARDRRSLTRHRISRRCDPAERTWFNGEDVIRLGLCVCHGGAGEAMSVVSFEWACWDVLEAAEIPVNTRPDSRLTSSLIALSQLYPRTTSILSCLCSRAARQRVELSGQPSDEL